MLHMQDVSKVFRTEMVETHALRNLSLEVPRRNASAGNTEAAAVVQDQACIARDSDQKRRPVRLFPDQVDVALVVMETHVHIGRAAANDLISEICAVRSLNEFSLGRDHPFMLPRFKRRRGASALNS